MGKGKIDKQVYEQYVDATVALFMEHYAAALTDTVSHEESSAVPYPEKLDERCIGMIRKECARQRSRAFWNGAKKVLSSAAILLVALLSLSSILFMTVEAFRIPVINFFIEQGDGFWAITGQDDTQDAPENSAARGFDKNDPLAGLIPEDYTLDRVRENLEQGQRIFYKNSAGNQIHFWIRPNASHITFDSEEAAVSQKCTIGKYEGVFVEKDEVFQVAWLDNHTNKAYLLLTNGMEKIDILALAEKICIKLLE